MTTPKSSSPRLNMMSRTLTEKKCDGACDSTGILGPSGLLRSLDPGADRRSAECSNDVRHFGTIVRIPPATRLRRGWNQPLGTAGFVAHPRPRKAAGPALRRDEDRGIHRPERTRPDQRSEVKAMFFDFLKAVGTVAAVLSEVLKLETEAVPVSRPAFWKVVACPRLSCPRLSDFPDFPKRNTLSPPTRVPFFWYFATLVPVKSRTAYRKRFKGFTVVVTRSATNQSQ